MEERRRERAEVGQQGCLQADGHHHSKHPSTLVDVLGKELHPVPDPAHAIFWAPLLGDDGQMGDRFSD